LQKRAELPEPRYGQRDWDLFRKIFGVNWNHFEGLNFDEEIKITEFNYENHIPEIFLAQKDVTQSENFKDMIKVMNLLQKTKYE